jgi:prepilin-type N-terminal cleavage/methylation domain-containing protein
MKNEQGFSLVELLIVVAIIAIIAAIAVPSLLTSRMAANEAGGIQGCRTIGSAEVAFAATNNQQYATRAELTAGQFLDTRYDGTFNGYTYDVGAVLNAPEPTAVPAGFAFVATPEPGMARYLYGIGIDQVVRYLGVIGDAVAPKGLVEGDGIGKK